MFKQITRLARHSAIYAVSTAIQKLPGFLLLPIYTSTEYISSRSAFSDYVMVFAFIAFMNFFYTYGMDSALMRYFFLGKHSRKTVFSSTFFVLLITSLVTTVLLLVFSEPLANLLLKSPDYANFIRLAAGILMLDALGNLPYHILRAEEKALQYTAYRGVRFLLELAFNILFVVVFKFGVIGILYTALAAAAINLLVMSPIILRYLTREINFSLAGEMMRFGLPFLPHGIAFTTIELVDRFIIPEILGKDALGVYGANYKFGAMLSLLVNAFRAAWQPFFLKIAQQPDAPQIYARVLSYFLLGAGMIVIGGTLFIEDVLTMKLPGGFHVLGPQYWDGIRIIPVVLFGYCFYGVYVVLTPGFYIKKQSKYMIIFTGSGAVMNIAANIILLTLWQDIWGAAIGTLLSYMTMALTIYLVGNRIYPIPLEWPRILKILVMISLVMGVYYTWNLSLLLRVGIFVAAALISWAAILSDAERAIALNRLRGFLKTDKS